MKLLFQEYGLAVVYILAAFFMFFVFSLFMRYSSVMGGIINTVSGTNSESVTAAIQECGKRSASDPGWTIGYERVGLP